MSSLTTCSSTGIWTYLVSRPIGLLHIGLREVDHRINSAHASFAINRNMLKNRNIALATSINFLNALVRSRLTYGSHAWRPTRTELSRIQTTYNYFLRSMIVNGFRRRNTPTHMKTPTGATSSIMTDCIRLLKPLTSQISITNSSVTGLHTSYAEATQILANR